jgi:LAO/AO transport system kinase
MSAGAESIELWARQVRAGEPRGIARALTAIENQAPEAEALIRFLFPYTGKAYCLGITGAPGTGKSTLLDRLTAHYRREGRTVGILAVDPSSPYTGGAILGDRIRMQTLALDPGVFIRSMATRGFLGGLARATNDAVLLLDAAGKDIVVVETVGVGQGEVDIVRLADCTVVVLIPGMGDDIQNLKAGLMEIADIFVLNKADREGADKFEQQLKSVLQLAPERDGWRAAVVRTVATEGKGIAELAEEIDRLRKHFATHDHRRMREITLWKQRLELLLGSRLVERILNREGQRMLERLAGEVADRRKDPYGAIGELLEHAGVRGKQ